MSNSKPFFVFLALFMLFSCSDTKVVETTVDESPVAPPISGYFKKRVLIEDYTGTWCGNCTRVAYAIELMQSQSDKVVTLAIHNGNDPYHFANYQPLKDMILPNPNDVLALPQSRLNRTIVWAYPEVSGNSQNQAKALTGNNAGLGLAMSSLLANNTINLDVNLKFAQNYSGLKLVVYLVENHLIYKQTNYSNYFGGQLYIDNFEHNHVLRHNITNLLGDVVIEQTNTINTINKNYTFAVPANIANANNIGFVAIVVDNNNLAINSRYIDINQSQGFEQNP